MSQSVAQQAVFTELPASLYGVLPASGKNAISFPLDAA